MPNQQESSLHIRSLESAQDCLSQLATSGAERKILVVAAYAKLINVPELLESMIQPGRHDFPAIAPEQRVELFRSEQFKSWVQAENAAGRPVLWLSDLDKAKAAGDTFTYFFEYRVRHQLFTEAQNKELREGLLKLDSISPQQQGEAKVNTPTQNAQLVLDLWRSHEFEGRPGIDLTTFWSTFYWPSNIGMSRDERQQMIKAFAPEYVSRIYPEVQEENQALKDSGVTPVIVSHGDLEIARAVAPFLGVDPINVVAEASHYNASDLHTGTGNPLVVQDPKWRELPQSGKLILFNSWVAQRFGGQEYVVAGFDGDSPSTDGGAMLTLRPRVGYFIVDTPGTHDAGRLPDFINFVHTHAGGYQAHFYAVPYRESLRGPRP